MSGRKLTTLATAILTAALAIGATVTSADDAGTYVPRAEAPIPQNPASPAACNDTENKTVCLD